MELFPHLDHAVLFAAAVIRLVGGPVRVLSVVKALVTLSPDKVT